MLEAPDISRPLADWVAVKLSFSPETIVKADPLATLEKLNEPGEVN
jgi:hypothetical protein